MTLTPEQSQRLHYAAIDVVAHPTFYDAGGHTIVGIPHAVWVRLAAIIDALPHPTAAQDPATTPDGR